MTQKLTKAIFNTLVDEARSICVLGHINPDGDSIGSVLACYNYARNLKGPGFDAATAYLESPPQKFAYLGGFDSIKSDCDERTYELCIICDAADTGRLGKFAIYYESARKTVLIDHHVTNPGYGDYALIDGEASSASELVYRLMDEDYVDDSVAAAVYTGIVHDTGVFRYPATHESTMRVAGSCISHGISFSSIVEDTYFSMSLGQKKLLGYLLYNMKSRRDGMIVYSYIRLETRKLLSPDNMDLDGMIDYMRTTFGAVMAVFLYETRDGRVKVSLRSNSDDIDVSRMALRYGGGGHKRAAGCYMGPDFEADMDILTELFDEQLEDSKK